VTLQHRAELAALLTGERAARLSGRVAFNTPARSNPLADPLRACCDYDLDDDGWWTLCPAHQEARAAFCAAWPTIKAALGAEPNCKLAAALAAVAGGGLTELPIDVDRVAQFVDALEILL